MAASCARTVGSFLRKCGGCSRNLRILTPQHGRQVVSRQICVSSALQTMDELPLGRIKYSTEYLKKQLEEYEIGKRHLANMMGEDPENFNQEDIDRSIKYLFPSGLFEKTARPLMKHPDVVFPKQRAIQWGEDKRPRSFQFYTGKETFFSLMHDAYGKMLTIERYEDRLRLKKLLNLEAKQIVLNTSRWMTNIELENSLGESVSGRDYFTFIRLMDRLASLRYAALEEDFIMTYRKKLNILNSAQMMPKLERDDRGVAFSTAEGHRKSSKASVIVRDRGSGCVTVNGREYLQYFPILQDREQLMFPLQFAGMLERLDLECTVSGGGRASQAGALRLAISRALLSFLTEAEMEDMRKAGLLTADPRVRERKKPGQEGARRKFTWKKR